MQANSAIASSREHEDEDVTALDALILVAMTAIAAAIVWLRQRPAIPVRTKARISDIVNARHEHWSRGLHQLVEARLRRLIADRGQGGHLTVEISDLLADQLRTRVGETAKTMLEVLHAHRVRVRPQFASAFREELERLAGRDRDFAFDYVQRERGWLPIEGDKINFAHRNEIDQQDGLAALYPNDGIGGPPPQQSFWKRNLVWALIVKIVWYLGA